MSHSVSVSVCLCVSEFHYSHLLVPLSKLWTAPPCQVDVSCTMVELYTNTLSDVLSGGKKVKVAADGSLRDAARIPIGSYEEMMV